MAVVPGQIVLLRYLPETVVAQKFSDLGALSGAVFQPQPAAGLEKSGGDGHDPTDVIQAFRA